MADGVAFFDANEDAVLDRLEQMRQLRRSQTVGADEQVARRIDQLRRWYPWMSGGANLSLSKAGVEPEQPVARVASTAAAKRKSKKGGLGWHSIGDVIKAPVRAAADVADFVTPEAAENVIGDVAGGAGHAVQAVTRTGLLAASAPWEELQGNFRLGMRLVHEQGVIPGLAKSIITPLAISELSHRPEQSQARIALGDLLHGRRVDVGHGFLPGGTVAKEQAENARKLATIDGHAATPGRWLASLVVEPGTKPYNMMSGLLDAAASWELDPTAALQGHVSEARKASRLLKAEDVATNAAGAEKVAAGLVEGRRNTVLPTAADAWITGARGRQVVDRLTTEKSPSAIWKASGGKIPIDEAVRLADASTPEEVQRVLREAVGIAIREKPTVPTDLGAEFRRRLDSVRMVQIMPGSHADLENLDDAVRQVDRWQKNVRLPADVIQRNNDLVARAATSADRYDAILGTVFKSVEHQLVEHGSDPDVAHRLTTAWVNNTAEHRGFWVNDIGENMRVPGVVVDGATLPTPTPHLFVEGLNRSVPLPDARLLRREMSTLAPIFKVPGVKESTAVLDYLQNRIWRNLTLIRGAWTVRVTGSNQARMATAQLDSMFSHPLSMLGRIVADDSRAGRALGKVPGVAVGRGQTSMLGDLLSNREESWKVLARTTSDWGDGTIRLSEKVRVPRASRHGIQGWADELGKLASDPIAREVAKTDDIAAVRKSFWDGPLSALRKEQLPTKPGLADRAGDNGADAYIDSVLSRLRTKTGDHPELMDAVATGQLRGKPIRVTQGDTRPAQRILKQLSADGVGPEVVLADRLVTLGRNAGREATESLDHAFDWAMNQLMSRPHNFFTANPTLSQYYWQRAAELVPHMSEEAIAQAADAARAAKLPKEQIAKFAKGAGKAGGLSLDQADVISHGFAIDETKRLLFDLGERQQWADVARIMSPFASAWSEELRSWARLGVETAGKPLRRVQQVVEGARGSGFFTRDPQTGDEVFQYPLSAELSNAVLGAPIPLTGRVAGLNLFSNNPLFPGVGPVMQVTVGQLIPNKPQFDWIHDLFFPAGEPRTGSGGPYAFLPAWAQKLRTAMNDPDSDRLFGNTVGDMAAYLASTGKYDLHNSEDLQRLEDDAVSKGRALYILRGLTQWGAPTAPTPQMIANDKDGHVVTAFKLKEEFRKLQDEDYDTAVPKFLGRHGEDALLFLQPRTRGGFTPTDRLHDWVRSNADVVRDHPDVYGYFAPDGGQFSFGEYDRQIGAGERETLTPRQQIQLANHRVAATVYRTLSDKMGPHPNSQGRALLSQLRDALIEQYPGYQPGQYDPTKLPDQLRQLQAAAKDKRLKSSPVTQGLKVYFLARDKALTVARSRDLTTLKGKQMGDVAAWLRRIAAAVGQQVPGFSRVFDEVLDRELTPEEQPQQEVAV